VPVREVLGRDLGDAAVGIRPNRHSDLLEHMGYTPNEPEAVLAVGMVAPSASISARLTTSIRFLDVIVLPVASRT
jgi:hypothetical protein